MKRIALVAAVVAIAACSKGDKSTTTDTTAAGGMVAPSTDGMGGAMTSGSSASTREMDSVHMSSGSTGGAMAGGAAMPKPDNKTGGAMGGDSAGMGGTHGVKDTLKKAPPR